MKIHHIRNATCVIETSNCRILVDPMLSAQGELPPFSAIRFKAKRNPLVELPANTSQVLENISHCLITHSQTFGIKALQHTDHLDTKGESFLVHENIPVICQSADAAYLKKYRLQVEETLEYWVQQPFGGGKIVAVPAKHGHGWNHRLMANSAGFFLELPDEPSIYISGDTVYTEDVERVRDEYKPDVSIVAAGSAQLDIGPPILMSLEEIVAFISKASGKIVLNHLEALNHCPTTREQLREILGQQGLLEKVFIPNDGEVVPFEC